MSLIYKGMVKNVLGNTQFTLTPPSGEAYKVTDIQIYNPSGTHVTINIDRATVGYFRVSGALGNHLPFIIETDAGILSPKMTILGLLSQKGFFKGYPVPSGSEFSLTGVHQSGSYVSVTYDIYDANDIKADMQDGANAKEQVYINYGNTGATISTTGTFDYDTPVNPSQFPDFPYNDDVPALRKIEVLGIVGSTFAPVENDGTDAIYTQYLKLTKDQTVLFDKDRNGFLFYDPSTTVSTDDNVGEGYSSIGNYSDVDHKMPLMFDPPLMFEQGQELLVQLSTVIANSGQDMAVADQEIGVILRVTQQ